MVLADTDHAELAEFGERADQVEGNAFTARCVKMQTVGHGNVHQVIGS